MKQKNEGAKSSSCCSRMCFHAVLHLGSFGRYLSVSSEYRSGCSMMSPCVWDSLYLYLGVGSLNSVSLVGACVIVSISIVVRGCRWSEGSSSMMLAQVFCLCWLCVYINVLGSYGVGGASPGSSIVDFRLISYVVSVSIGIGES